MKNKEEAFNELVDAVDTYIKLDSQGYGKAVVREAVVAMHEALAESKRVLGLAD